MLQVLLQFLPPQLLPLQPPVCQRHHRLPHRLLHQSKDRFGIVDIFAADWVAHIFNFCYQHRYICFLRPFHI